MVPKKISNALAISLLCLSAVALAGLNIHQYRQIQLAIEKPSITTSIVSTSPEPIAAENRVAALENAEPEAIAGTGARQAGGSKADELIYHLESAEEELAVIQDQLAADQVKAAERRKMQKELQKKYRVDPSFKKAVKEGLDLQYADLFKKLNLSDEKLALFKDLLFEESMAQQDFWLERGGSDNLTEEQIEEWNSGFQALNEAYESKKSDLLGETGYATYQAYSTTQHERYQVNEFLSFLDSDAQLTESQKESLIEAMAEGVDDVKFERPASDDGSPEEMQMEMSLNFQSRQHAAYLEAASSILSTSQLEQFEGYLENQLEQQRLFMEMQALRSEDSDDTSSIVVISE